MPEVEITAMMFGPYGVGRLDGMTVMVPQSVPGDWLEVTLGSRRRNYAIARLERVLRSAAGRRVPPCPFLPRCGGCDWQQISYPEQLHFKGEVIANEMRHALGIEIDPRKLVQPAPREFGYRSRIRLKTGPAGKLGFLEAGTHRLVEIDHCMLAAVGLRLPHHLAKALGGRCAEIEVVRNDGREVLIAHMMKPPVSAEAERARRVMAEDDAIAAIVLRCGNAREVIGDPAITIELEPGLELEADADVFSQVNHEQNRKLVAAVTKMAVAGPAVEVLDLFCGAGNFSLPAARRGARVTGVDADALAVAAASRNAGRLGLNEARFVAGNAAQTARFLLQARYSPKVVIIDPPRTGAADLMQLIARFESGRVIYVSCDVSTLVRDLGMLADKYRVEQVCAFDFFPNTHHAEIAVQMVLT
jgi:23S rRNA (uracil1939-C5)-methyltransferase